MNCPMCDEPMAAGAPSDLCGRCSSAWEGGLRTAETVDVNGGGGTEGGHMACQCGGSTDGDVNGTGSRRPESRKNFDALSFLLEWEAVCGGGADREVGAHAFFKAPFRFRGQDAAEEYGFCFRCIQAASSTSAYGLLVWADEDGYTNYRRLATAADYREALKALTGRAE